MDSYCQFNLTNIKDRCEYLLQSGILADCHFLVGTSSNQRVFAGHRCLLAMASPVFERMFCGNLAGVTNPIVIPDVQPDAFKAMLYYIYTDRLDIASFDKAFELCYVAKKYMLPHVVERCIQFVWTDLSPKNACRAYEFAKLFNDPRLMESSMEHIATSTLEVIADPSFLDIEASTLMDILDQNRLNIDSELDLFNSLVKFSNERGTLHEKDTMDDNEGDLIFMGQIKSEPKDSKSEAAFSPAGACGNIPIIGAEEVVLDGNASGSVNATINNIMDTQRTRIDEAMLRQAVKKIRFLAMTPQQFTAGPGVSTLLLQSDGYAILKKLVCPSINDPMPEGYCQLGKRERDGSDLTIHQRYCIVPIRTLSGFIKENVSSLSFNVDTNIYLLGVRIQSSGGSWKTDGGSFIASIENMEENKIAGTTRVIKNNMDEMFDLSFTSPIFIYRNRTYKIEVTNMHIQPLLFSSWDREMVNNGVKFSILNVNPNHINLGSAIYGVVFTKQQDLSRN